VLQRLRSRLTYANVTATIAIFMVLTGIGFAVAAKLPKRSVGPKQIRNGAVHSRKIHKNAVNASKIKTSAVGRSEIAHGAVGGGEIANKAVTRKKIDDSALPLLATLRSGQELRGSFNLGGNGGVASTAHDGYDFQFPLTNQPSAPTANVIDVVANDPNTASCGGLGGGNQQTPLAAPGNLCIYITGKTNLAAANPVVVENVNRLGFGLKATSLAAGDFVATGFWAVTAP
jgi:hypothetical protein